MSDCAWLVAVIGGALLGWGYRGISELKRRAEDASEISNLHAEVCKLKLLIRLGSKGDE